MKTGNQWYRKIFSMIVSDTEKFIFIHNPKCAGTSIRSCLIHYDTTKNFFSGYKMINGQKLALMHLPLWKLDEIFPYFIDSKIRQYYTFTTVRNPYTRTISAFNSAQELIYVKFKETGNIKEYSEKLNTFISSMDKSKLDSIDHSYRHFIRQSDFVFFNNEKLIDTVMKYEEIPDAFDSMKWMHTLIAYRIQNNFKHLNKRFIGNNTIDFLRRSSIDRINSLYEKDFLNFEYSML